MRSREAWRTLVASIVLSVAALALAWSPGPIGAHGWSSTASADAAASQHRVVALGDSVPAGSACSCTPFPQAYGALLARRTGAPVTVTNEAVGGLDTAGVLAQLEQPLVASDVRRADVVLVTIGANDFSGRHDDVVEDKCTADGDVGCVREELQTMRVRLDAILARIQALRSGRPTTLLVTGYWNVFEDKEVAEREFGADGLQASLDLTREVNAAIRAVSTTAGAHYVDLFAPFHLDAPGDDTLLAEDGDHPDAAGHRLIAETLLEAGLPRTD